MLLPDSIKRLLEGNSFYIKLRYSKLFYWFWLLLRVDVRQEIHAKKDFYQSFLPPNGKLIFDIGANEGILTEIFSNHSKQVIAVEPAARNVTILQAKFHHQKDVIIIPKAVSHTSGTQDWYEDKNDYAMGTLSSKWNSNKQEQTEKSIRISTITLDDLIQQFGKPAYIKIDVEGYERQALQGLSQPVSLLSFEAILPQFLDETILCIKHLITISANTVFTYQTENRFAYDQYQSYDILLNDIKASGKQ